jgi:hypothetical protein
MLGILAVVGLFAALLLPFGKTVGIVIMLAGFGGAVIGTITHIIYRKVVR